VFGCLCTTCMQHPQRPKDSIGVSGTGLTDGCKLRVAAENQPNSGPLEEQAVLLASEHLSGSLLCMCLHLLCSGWKEWAPFSGVPTLENNQRDDTRERRDVAMSAKIRVLATHVACSPSKVHILTFLLALIKPDISACCCVLCEQVSFWEHKNIDYCCHQDQTKLETTSFLPSLPFPSLSLFPHSLANDWYRWKTVFWFSFLILFTGSNTAIEQKQFQWLYQSLLHMLFVLVAVLLLWRDTMTMAIFKNISLFILCI